MNCIQCGEPSLTRAPIPFSLTVAGTEFVSELPGRQCSSCGLTTVNGPAGARFELQVAAELVPRGLRSGETFRFMRKALGMKAIELARVMNVAPETISRWENGQREVDWPALTLLGFLVDDKLAGRTLAVR